MTLKRLGKDSHLTETSPYLLGQKLLDVGDALRTTQPNSALGETPNAWSSQTLELKI